MAGVETPSSKDPVAGAPRAREQLSEGNRGRRRKRQRQSNIIVGALAAASAIGGAVAGCHPTGTPVVDQFYAAFLAALVTVAAGLASRYTLLFLSAVVAAMSRGWLLLPGAAALGLAFSSVFLRRPYRRLGALIGALGVQVLLRWPQVGLQGLTALVATAALLPCLVSAWGHLSKRWRRRVLRTGVSGAVLALLLIISAAVGALTARHQVQQGLGETTSALATITNQSSGAGIRSLGIASNDFATVRHRTGSWWSAGADLVPIVAQQRRAVAGGSGAARDIASAAVHEASGVDLNALSSHGGQINLTQIHSLGGPVDTLDRVLLNAQARLAHIRSHWLVPPVRSRLDTFATQLTKAQGRTEVASQAIRVTPGLLGEGSMRHYLVVFMTPSESRGLGGFIGAYAELSVDNGRIQLTRSGRATELNTKPPGSRKLTGPPDFLAQYGLFHPADNFEDLTYSPDFPTDADVISQLYPQSGGDHIDGVLALDPYGLASLLKVTGPITIPGLSTPLSSANAADFLVRGQYYDFASDNASTLARHDFLQEALNAAFQQLVSGPLPAPQTLAQLVGPDVHAGRLLFWSNHPDEQPLLRRLGLSGAFPRVPGQDLLAVTSQNAANNKADAFLTRTVLDRVTFDPATGNTQSAVTIELHNATPANAPEDFLTSYQGSGLAPGTNRAWVTIYSPLTFIGGTAAGAPLSLNATPALGVNAYSGYVNILAGQTVMLHVNLSGRLRPSKVYDLTVRQQPGVGTNSTTAEISSGPGWHISGSPDMQFGTAEAVRRSVHCTSGSS